MTTLIIPDKEINDIIKIVKSLEESSLLIKVVSKTIKNKAKEQKGGFLIMLLVKLGASLLGNLLTGKKAIRGDKSTTIAGEGKIRAGQIKGKSLLDYTNLFPPNDYEKNGKIIPKYFQQLKRWKNYIALFVVWVKNLKTKIP